MSVAVDFLQIGEGKAAKIRHHVIGAGIEKNLRPVPFGDAKTLHAGSLSCLNARNSVFDD